MISLTGDVSTGKKVLEAASQSIKKTHLELGGKAPVIVFDDADIDLLIEGVRTLDITMLVKIVQLLAGCLLIKKYMKKLFLN